MSISCWTHVRTLVRSHWSLTLISGFQSPGGRLCQIGRNAPVGFDICFHFAFLLQPGCFLCRYTLSLISCNGIIVERVHASEAHACVCAPLISTRKCTLWETFSALIAFFFTDITRRPFYEHMCLLQAYCLCLIVTWGKAKCFGNNAERLLSYLNSQIRQCWPYAYGTHWSDLSVTCRGNKVY